MGIWLGWTSLVYYLDICSSIYGVWQHFLACYIHSTPLLFPLLAVKCWRMEAAGNSLAQSSSCKVGTFAAHNYVSLVIQCIHVYFRLFAALSNTTHVEWDVWGSNGMVVWPLLPAPGSCPWFLFAMSWSRAHMLTCWFSRYPCRYPCIHSRYLQLALISARYDI